MTEDGMVPRLLDAAAVEDLLVTRVAEPDRGQLGGCKFPPLLWAAETEVETAVFDSRPSKDSEPSRIEPRSQRFPVCPGVGVFLFLAGHLLQGDVEAEEFGTPV